MEFCAASVQGDIFDELVLWEDHIGRIVEVVRKDDFETLTAVMENVVRPLLTLKPLNWDDSRIRMRTTRSGLPVMALCDPEGQEKIVVAVGPAPRAHDATHPFHESGGTIQLAVAADGRKWAFHLSVPAGGVREREFCSFDIVSDPRRRRHQCTETLPCPERSRFRPGPASGTRGVSSEAVSTGSSQDLAAGCQGRRAPGTLSEDLERGRGLAG